VSATATDTARRREIANNERQADRIKARLEGAIERAQPLIEASKKGQWRMGKDGWEIVDLQGHVLWSEKTAPVGMNAL
jgi:hypothetical protein